MVDVPNLFVIETLDSSKIAKAVNDAWTRYNKKGQLNVMIQFNTSEEHSEYSSSSYHISNDNY